MKTSREELLAVAFKLFLTKGYLQTSMMDLSKTAGVSKGAFHHYFPRKSDILDACIAHFFTDFFATETELENLDLDALTKVYARGYAKALVNLQALDIPLANYQAFLWDLIKQNRGQFEERYKRSLELLVSKLRERESMIGQDIAQQSAMEFMAMIEGTGVLLSLQEQVTAHEIENAFSSIVESWLENLQSRAQTTTK